MAGSAVSSVGDVQAAVRAEQTNCWSQWTGKIQSSKDKGCAGGGWERYDCIYMSACLFSAQLRGSEWCSNVDGGGGGRDMSVSSLSLL